MTTWPIRRRFIILFTIAFVFTTVLFVFNSVRLESYVFDRRINRIFLAAKNRSLCSSRAARRGLDQHVLSVSAYESTDRLHLVTSLTWSYIQIFVKEAKTFYPSWVVRVYHYDLHNKTKKDFEELESKYENLDFCNCEDLPVLGNMKGKLPGKMQRFLPAIDPTVGVFIVRDLDSEIFQREVDAVQEWLTKTSYAFHIMRDNAQHGIEMLGGLWGLAPNRLSINDRFKIAKALLPSEESNQIQQFVKNYADRGDQRFLTDQIWPIARRNSITHDSFYCLWSRYVYQTDTRPFPSQRKYPDCFVGCPKPCCQHLPNATVNIDQYAQCPFVCRPKNHRDWIFC